MPSRRRDGIGKIEAIGGAEGIQGVDRREGIGGEEGREEGIGEEEVVHCKTAEGKLKWLEERCLCTLAVPSA